MKKLSFKFKVALWVTVLVTVTSLLSALAVVFFSNRVSETSAKRTLIAAVERNLNEIKIYSDRSSAHLDDEFDILVESDGLFIEIDDDFTKNTSFVSSSLYNGGSILYGENLFGSAPVDFAETGVRRIKVRGTAYYIYDKRIKTGADSEIWLRGTVELDTVYSQTVSVAEGFLPLIPFLLLLTLAGAFIIAVGTIKPLEKISREADSIQKGDDLSRRITAEGSREINALVASFNAMLSRLENAFERERTFNTDVSHELRTPVAVITSACELALEEKSREQYEESLEIIKNQSEKMNSMINALLEYSRLETDKSGFRKTDLSALVDRLCGEVRLSAEKGITLKSEIEKGIFVNGAENLLSRLAENLIINAYKYGREGGTITVKLYKEKYKAILKVKDDGIGIKEEDIGKIFDLFYRSDSSRSQPGFGLGLSFVKRTALLHSGEITVESKEGEGSEFTFTCDLF